MMKKVGKISSVWLLVQLRWTLVPSHHLLLPDPFVSTNSLNGSSSVLEY